MVGLIREWNGVFWREVRKAIHGLPAVQRFRASRYEMFERMLRPDDVIADVGAGTGNALEYRNRTHRIIAIDMRDHAAAFARFPNVEFRRGDARALPLAAGECSVVFCNSLIEHVPVGDRERVASEIRRVADRYWVQTPNRYFPIEPHYMLPLFQFLPMRLRRHFDRRKNDEIELLTAAQLQRLFPDASIYRERIGGLTKSLVAHR